MIIPLSKVKLIKLFIGAISFVVAGILFSLKPFWFTKANDTTIVLFIGYAAMIFFGLAAVYIGIKIFDKKPGLVIDDEGITDNSGGASAGKILWRDIKDIYRQQVMKEQFIMLEMKNPEYYLQREKNPIKKRIMELNDRIYGTPVSISVNALKISSEELYALLFTKCQNSI